MSKVKTTAKGPRLEFQRIRVDAQGYDDTGAYWGAGPDVFIATTDDGGDQVTVRASNVTEAKSKIAAELARNPGEPQSNRDPLGGASPHKTRYEVDWIDPASGRTIKLRITHSRDYLSSGSDHIEIETLEPKRAALPITETGYRSHFMAALDLMNAGGPVTFATSWLAREAAGKEWKKAATVRAQGDLFQWAEAQRETGKRKASRKAQTPPPRRRRRSDPERDPQ